MEKKTDFKHKKVMKTIRTLAILTARLLLSLIFLISGVSKLFHWQETEHDLMSAICDWQAHAGLAEPIQQCLSAMAVWGPLSLVIGLLFELIGALMLLFGVREKLGATLLLLFLIPTTLLFHSFWFMEGPSRDIQTAMFFKNLAIFGGLLLVLVHGAQAKPKEGGIPVDFT